MYRQGDPADSVFYIRNGKVKAPVVSGQGKEAVVALLGADDFFGEGCIRTITHCAIAEAVDRRSGCPAKQQRQTLLA